MVKSRRQLLQWKLGPVFVSCHPCPRISHSAVLGSDAVVTVGKFSWKVNPQWNKSFNTCGFQLELLKEIKFHLQFLRSHWLPLHPGTRVWWCKESELSDCRVEPGHALLQGWRMQAHQPQLKHRLWEHCRKRVHKQHVLLVSPSDSCVCCLGLLVLRRRNSSARNGKSELWICSCLKKDWPMWHCVTLKLLQWHQTAGVSSPGRKAGTKEITC